MAKRAPKEKFPDGTFFKVSIEKTGFECWLAHLDDGMLWCFDKDAKKFWKNLPLSDDFRKARHLKYEAMTLQEAKAYSKKVRSLSDYARELIFDDTQAKFKNASEVLTK